jgi:hypothetical protein
MLFDSVTEHAIEAVAARITGFELTLTGDRLLQGNAALAAALDPCPQILKQARVFREIFEIENHLPLFSVPPQGAFSGER